MHFHAFCKIGLLSIALLGGLLMNFVFGISWMDYIATGVILAFVAKESMEAFQEQTSLPSMGLPIGNAPNKLPTN